MGVVHHASYLAYLEETRVEYLRALGRPYDQLRADGVEFPVVEAALQYRRPLRFDDVVDIGVMVASAGAATFQMSYLVGSGGVTSATGVTVHGVVTGQGPADAHPGLAPGPCPSGLSSGSRCRAPSRARTA